MNKLEVPYEVLPKNYPAQVFEELARLTGRKLIAHDFSQSNLTTINVWLALRDAYLFFGKMGEHFQYREKFSFPEYYTIEQTLEHLIGMLAQFRSEEAEEEESIFEHLGRCEPCYKYLKAILNSFLEAIQGMHFEDRIRPRLVTLLSELKIIFQESGLNLTLFTPQQSMALSDLRVEFGVEGIKAFFREYLTPFLREKQKDELSMSELMVLITKFRANQSTN